MNEQFVKKNIAKDGKQTSRKRSFIHKSFRHILDGSILTKRLTQRLLPFGLYMSLLAIIYIGHNYWAERTIRNIEKVKRELKELRSEHISTKSEFMYSSKQSEIAKRLNQYGLNESTTPPYKIIANTKNKN